ncbi:helix-turn-helix transcriptional regulator [Flavihumibacter solisilvae]|uniref:HTH araC/xylS-type domain-containing protein n=1 Tax=Flavihumibacter solisilvae TaxID=1349421 RepID=A0A0C1ID83_9BACT|nr:helix-turn-helix transcriptional regulator [Flavihumibacter solisilvae]KIC92000.1 hypothetical protein OI18_22005 [Flavihumibacter solisilvae]
MIPKLHTEQAGIVTGTLSPLHNGQVTGTNKFHFKLQSSLLTVQVTSTADASWELWNIDCKQADKIWFQSDGHPLAIICSLEGSTEWTTPGKARKILHERSSNGIVSTEPSQLLAVRKNTNYCFLIIRFKAATLVKNGFPLAISDRFLLSRSLILGKPQLKWLTSSPVAGFEDPDYLSKGSKSFLDWLTGDHPRRAHQPKALTLDEANWFYLEKKRLLQNIHLHLPYNELLVDAGILQPERFKRRLRQLYGISLRELVTESRIDTAQELLRENDHPIKKIAQLTGFPNVHYFTRVFAKETGVPPGVYQEQHGL